jgi:hypothetical protein
VFRGKEGGEADDFKILRGDIGHARGETEFWGLLGACGLLGLWSGGGGRARCAAGRDGGASTLLDLFEAPGIESEVRVDGIEEGELGVMLFFLADALWE